MDRLSICSSCSLFLFCWWRGGGGLFPVVVLFCFGLFFWERILAWIYSSIEQFDLFYRRTFFLSVSLSVRLPVYLPLCLRLCLCQSLCLCVCLSVDVCLCLSLSISLSLSVCRALQKPDDSAAGQDEVHYNPQIHLPETILSVLLKVSNSIWGSGSFPPSGSEEMVIPVPKPGAGIMEADDRQMTAVFSPTVTPPSALDKPSIMKRYHGRRTTRWGVTARSPTMVTLHDTGFVEYRWWNDGWTVKTVVTWRSSASMLLAPG